MALFIIDASGFQANVDWAVADKILVGGWEKVSEGTNYVNPYWTTAKPAMLARAKATGFVPGAYMFLEHGNGPAQAQNFATNAGDLDGFGIMVDVEPFPRINSFPTMADAVACVNELRKLYPKHPIAGYIPQWYWGSQDTTFCDYLWASHYILGTGSPAWLYSRVPASYWDGYGGSQVSLLQFTPSAVVPGVSGLVDCEAFRGTVEEYAKLVLPATTPPPPPPIPTWEIDMMNALPTLQLNDTHHPAVRRAQALLGPAGAPVKEDGIFGPATEHAVKVVQSGHGIKVDGVVDKATWEILVTGQH